MATDDADARRAGDERDPREAVAAYQARALKLARDLKVSEAREAALREAIGRADRERDAMHESLGDLLRAVGMHDGARPESPAAVHAMAVRLVREIVAALAAGEVALRASEAREAALREAIRKACATFDAAFKERTIGFFTASAIDDLLRRALAEHDARGGRKGSDGDVPAEM
jgi:hypothetical protein